MKKRFINALSTLFVLGMLIGCSPKGNTPSGEGGGGGGTIIDPVDESLDSISVNNPKTSYIQDDEFVKPTVIATYKNNKTSDVTSKSTFSGYDMSKTGNQTVTVSYTEGEITKTTTYGINVNAKVIPDPPKPVTITMQFANFYADGSWMKLTYDNDPFAVTGHTYSYLKLNGNKLAATEVDNLPDGKYVNVHVSTDQLTDYLFEWVDDAGETYFSFKYSHTPVTPDPGPTGDAKLSFKMFYGDGQWMQLSYEVDPFAMTGHTFKTLKLNHEEVIGNDIDNVPGGKYLNVHVYSDKLPEYLFEWYDTDNVLYCSYKYTNSGAGGDTPGPIDPTITDDLGEDETSSIPVGTNADHISILGIDNVNWAKGQYFDVFNGVAATSDGKDITNYIEVNGSVNYGKVGTYELEYVIQYGNSNMSYTRTVTVTEGDISRDTSTHTLDVPTLPTSERGSIASGNIYIPHPANASNIDNELKNRALPTNTWYSGMFAPNGQSVTGLFANQYRTMFTGKGFSITDISKGMVESYPNDFDDLTKQKITTFSNFGIDIDHLYVSNPSLSTGASINLLSYSDNSAKFGVRNSNSNADEMVMSIAQGSPYLVFENNGEKAFNLDFNYYGSVENYNYYDLNGNKLNSLSYTGEAIIAELVHVHRGYEFNLSGIGAAFYRNIYFLINAPEGSSFSISHKLHPDKSKMDSITLTPKDSNYISIAPLGDGITSVSASINMIKRLHKHSYAVQDRANSSYKVNHATNVIETTFRSNVHRLNKNNKSNVLYTLQPHQYKKTDATISSFYISSMRGKLRFTQAKEFKTYLNFKGLLPSFAVPTGDSEFTTNMISYLNILDTNTNYDGVYDKETTEGKDDPLDVNEPYWNSKAIYPLSQGLMVASQLNQTTLVESFISKLRYVLEDWYKYEGESDDRFLYYNQNWGSLYTNNSNFGVNERLTDHHFTYGYLVYASSVLAMYDSSFLGQYQSVISLLLKDYFNYDRNNVSFPYMRCFDSYNGHSWSDGFGNFRDGNNQESTGEALNSYTGAYLFGLATNNQDLVDASIYAFTTELYSVKQYWFDYDEDVWYNINIPEAAGIHALGMVWGGKNEHKTWFGPSPEFIYGIQWLPTGEYLSSYALGSSEQEMLTKIYQSMIARRKGEPLTWFSNMWSIEALTKNNTASSKFDSSKILNDDYPNELVGAYLMVKALEKYGTHSDTDFMEIENQVSCSVYQKGSTKVAMVWNASGVNKTIRIHVGNTVVTKTVAPGLNSYSL